jgi:hypothetical protein
MSSRIWPAIVLPVVAMAIGFAQASVPSVADLDASQRAAGNRLDLATKIGQSIFSVTWPAQVTQISANAVDSHVIVGIRLWGVRFHRPLSRAEFTSEIAALVERAFAAVPQAEEIDVWASVPIAIEKGIVVSGDLAKPTTRTVFSLTVRRGESASALVPRAEHGAGAFWDEEWAQAAFKNQGSH